jgi:hypothetical protein
MTERESIKMHLIERPEDKRIELENFVDNNLEEIDIIKVTNYLNELNKSTSHRIIEIQYSEQGDLYIKAETGLTFIK